MLHWRELRFMGAIEHTNTRIGNSLLVADRLFAGG